MSRKKRKQTNNKAPKVEKAYNKHIDTVLLSLYRALKNEKLFGNYIRCYRPLDTNKKVEISKFLPRAVSADVDGLYVPIGTRDMENSEFLNNMYLLQRIHDQTKNYNVDSPRELKFNKLNGYYSNYFFNKNKENYKIKINQLKFELIFGLLFSILGMTCMSFILYYILGFFALIGVLVFLSIFLFVGQYYFTSS